MPSDSFNQDRRRFVNKERISPAIMLDVGDAQPRTTLPFVFALMSNLSGTALSRQPGLDKRDLQQVLDRHSFNSLFEKFSPELEKVVKNRILPSEGDLKLQLKFKSMADFTPERIVQQVPVLREWLERRNDWQLVKNTIGADPEKKKRIAEALKDGDLRKAIKGS